jgi:hypothetical protein
MQLGLQFISTDRISLLSIPPTKWSVNALNGQKLTLLCTVHSIQKTLIILTYVQVFIKAILLSVTQDV